MGSRFEARDRCLLLLMFRHGLAPRSFFRDERRVLDESAEDLRASPGREKIRRNDQQPADSCQADEKAWRAIATAAKVTKHLAQTVVMKGLGRRIRGAGQDWQALAADLPISIQGIEFQSVRLANGRTRNAYSIIFAPRRFFLFNAKRLDLSPRPGLSILCMITSFITDKGLVYAKGIVYVLPPTGQDDGAGLGPLFPDCIGSDLPESINVYLNTSLPSY